MRLSPVQAFGSVALLRGDLTSWHCKEDPGGSLKDNEKDKGASRTLFATMPNDFRLSWSKATFHIR